MTEMEWIPLSECEHGDIVRPQGTTKELRVLSRFARWEGKFIADPVQFVLVDRHHQTYNILAETLVCRIQRFQSPRTR